MTSRSLDYFSNVTGTGPSRLTWLLETGLLVFVGYILAYYIPQVSLINAFVFLPTKALFLRLRSSFVSVLYWDFLLGRVGGGGDEGDEVE